MTKYSRLNNPRGKYDYVVADGVPGKDIIFRNFSGGPTAFNPNNKDRTFGLVIEDEEFARTLEREGWKIKWFEPKNDGDERNAYLIVKVQFRPVVPKVYIENQNKSHTRVTEDIVGTLDDADISNVRIALNGRQVHPQNGGNPYPKPYVAEMVITLAPSIFGIDYSDSGDDGLDIASDELPF